ncbi:ADP-ribosylglycohydrolase family protein [Rhizobium sp. G187]|uniref:ADP-ribosylglycohydrolase family protein n=1 Tax=Rhizobium sp. G187 TaxID=3451352 RepID=UPI003EE442C8
MTDSSISLADRAAGAVLGGLIGEALGVGVHWYYDLEQLHRDHGPWIDDYKNPMPGRYHEGLKAGEMSQIGYIAEMLLDSVLEQKTYSERDFTAKLDGQLFPLLDGSAMSGPGGYTNQSIRETWRNRVQHRREWGQVASLADTTEGAERIFILAALYAADPARAATACRDNTLLTQNDTTVVALTTAFSAVLSAVVRGVPLNGEISAYLMDLVRDGQIPFHHVTSKGLQPPGVDVAEAPVGSNFPSPDAILGVSTVVKTAQDSLIRLEPASKVAQVYGMPCAIYYQLPAAYYLAARFPDDFETAVLSAINGGGQNQARAVLTGALAGAQVGLTGIPVRFIRGLQRGDALRKKAEEIGKLAEAFQLDVSARKC